MVPVRAPFPACRRRPSRCEPTRWRETDGHRRTRSGSQMNPFLLVKITGRFIFGVDTTQPYAGQEERPEWQAPRAGARS